MTNGFIFGTAISLAIIFGCYLGSVSYTKGYERGEVQGRADILNYLVANHRIK